MKSRRQTLRRALLAAFFLLLPITLNYYSPYLMTTGTAARVATFSLGFWAAVFASSLVLGRSFCGVAVAGNLITYFALVGMTLAPLALGRRGFCRYFCPFGVWAIAGEWLGNAVHIPRLKLDAHPDACSACGSCSRVCPMQLPVQDMVERGDMRETECFMCETCADTCSSGAITLGFGSTRVPSGRQARS